MKDLYQILGVNKSASDSEIKKAYRRLASQYHPDKGGSTEKFQEIQTAYDVLIDPARRAEYDSPSPFHVNRSGNFDFDTIFNMFGARFSENASRSGAARIQLWISLYDAAVGGPRTISVSSPAGQNNIEITIPSGITDGAAVRYSRIAPGGMDLVVHFRIRPEPGWERNDDHVTKDVCLDIWDLILGTEIEVQTLHLQSISIKVPPLTNPGTMLRVRGHGMPHRNSAARGDLFVRISARLPSKISPELLEHIGREHGR